MKVLLYTEGYKTISKSGLGKAIKHQMRALEEAKRKAEEEKNENLNTNLAALEAAENAEKELKQVHEKLKEKAHSGNTLDSFNACNELLSK